MIRSIPSRVCDVSAGVALTLAGMLAFLGTAPLARGDYEKVYSEGHADLGVAYSDGNLRLEYQFNSSTVLDGELLGTGAERYRYAPNEILTHVKPTARLERLAGEQWDFTGVLAGEDFWVLPQTRTAAEAAKIPFMGFAARSSYIGSSTDWAGPITFSLLDVSGPGNVSVWQNDTFGNPVSSMTSFDGVSLADDLWSQSLGGHSHHNIGFSAPGVYDITLLAHGQHVTDGGVWAIETFRVNVVPEPSALALLGIGGTAMLLLRRRARKAKP